MAGECVGCERRQGCGDVCFDSGLRVCGRSAGTFRVERVDRKPLMLHEEESALFELVAPAPKGEVALGYQWYGGGVISDRDASWVIDV